MTVTALAPHNEVSSAVMETVILHGDLARLSPAQKLDYMHAVCKSLGLNPLTKPFAFLRLNGKEIMYALRDCTEQLRKLHAVSVTIAARETVEECYVVTARAQDSTGRCDESIGAVSIKGLTGEARANALMKTETKAKRRVTLSICGLGMLDETETETIPGATRAPEYTPPMVQAAREAVNVVTAKGAPLDAGKASSGATSITSITGNAPSKPRTAADVKPTGGPITPDQVRAIHTLKGQIGGLTDEAYRKGVAVYRQENGERCVGEDGLGTSTLLSKDQASHLIGRFEEKIQKQGSRAGKGFDEPANPAPPLRKQPTFAELADMHFENGDSSEFLRATFGVSHPQELDAAEAATALELLLVYGTDEEEALTTKLRAMGKIR